MHRCDDGQRMRKNERARLARRAAYQRAQVLAQPFQVELPDDMTTEQFNELDDLSTAYHEAGHAVAAWIQGIDARLEYLPEGVLTKGRDLGAITRYHPSLNLFLTQPGVGALTFNRGIITDSRGIRVGTVNDGGVMARKLAFITTAGPWAEILAFGHVLPHKQYQHIFKIHGDEAMGTLMHYTVNPTIDEIKSAQARIGDLVEKTFREPRVITCVRALAERFHKARTLTEKEVRETIEAAWADANVPELAEAMTTSK